MSLWNLRGLCALRVSISGTESGPLEGYACQLLSDEAVLWLSELRDPDRPFLMVVGYHEPHEAIALDGANLAPAFTGDEIDRATPLFWHDYKAWGGPRVVLREGRFKLAAWWDGPEILRTDSATMRPGDLELIRTAKLVRFALYDLETDPGERHDVTDQYPEVFAQMKTAMLEIYGEIQADVHPWNESWLRRW